VALVYPSQSGRLKAAWNWGSDSSVLNGPLGEPHRTPLYVGLPSAWGSVDCGDFFPHFVGGLLNWGLVTYKLRNKPLTPETEQLLSIGTLLGEHVGGLPYWGLGGKSALSGNA